jgi:ankyrin repeat protein
MKDSSSSYSVNNPSLIPSLTKQQETRAVEYFLSKNSVIELSYLENPIGGFWLHKDTLISIYSIKRTSNEKAKEILTKLISAPRRLFESIEQLDVEQINKIIEENNKYNIDIMMFVREEKNPLEFAEKFHEKYVEAYSNTKASSVINKAKFEDFINYVDQEIRKELYNDNQSWLHPNKEGEEFSDLIKNIKNSDYKSNISEVEDFKEEDTYLEDQGKSGYNIAKLTPEEYGVLLLNACKEKKIEKALGYLLHEVNFELTDELGNTALHYACMNMPEVALELIRLCQKLVTMVNNHGCTALHKAFLAKVEENSLIKLIENSKDAVDIQDGSGMTVLHYACALKMSDAALVIIKLSNNVDIKDKKGTTAGQIFQIREMPDVVEAIKAKREFLKNQAELSETAISRSNILDNLNKEAKTTVTQPKTNSQGKLFQNMREQLGVVEEKQNPSVSLQNLSALCINEPHNEEFFSEKENEGNVQKNSRIKELTMALNQNKQLLAKAQLIADPLVKEDQMILATLDTQITRIINIIKVISFPHIYGEQKEKFIAFEEENRKSSQEFLEIIYPKIEERHNFKLNSLKKKILLEEAELRYSLEHPEDYIYIDPYNNERTIFKLPIINGVNVGKIINITNLLKKDEEKLKHIAEFYEKTPKKTIEELRLIFTTDNLITAVENMDVEGFSKLYDIFKKYRLENMCKTDKFNNAPEYFNKLAEIVKLGVRDAVLSSCKKLLESDKGENKQKTKEILNIVFPDYPEALEQLNHGVDYAEIKEGYSKKIISQTISAMKKWHTSTLEEVPEPPFKDLFLDEPPVISTTKFLGNLEYPTKIAKVKREHKNKFSDLEDSKNGKAELPEEVYKGGSILEEKGSYIGVQKRLKFKDPEIQKLIREYKKSGLENSESEKPELPEGDSKVMSIIEEPDSDISVAKKPTGDLWDMSFLDF